MVKGYYDNRYFLYAQHKADALLRRAARSSRVGAHDAAFEFTDDEVTAYISDVMKAACMFGHKKSDFDALPSSATGDAVAIARELLVKYPPTS